MTRSSLSPVPPETPVTVADWVDYTQTLHNRSIDLSLDRVRIVRDRLGLDCLPFTVIAIAGTNGKGSTVAMLESIYAAAGYRTAAFTSPHLVRYNERIRIDGADVDDAALLDSFERVEAARLCATAPDGEITLTYFEFGTLAAVDLIARSGVDVALLEVGLGGRLDAVRAFEAAISVVTSVGLDHQDWLGPDRESIGREKAGIGQTGRSMVCADVDPPNSVAVSAHKNAVRLLQSGEAFGFTRHPSGGWQWWSANGDVHTQLPDPGIPGEHQHANAAAVVAVIAALDRTLPVSAEALATGLAEVRLAGRLQIIGTAPLQIIDVSHNAQAARSLVQFLENNTVPGRTHVVFAMLGDKPVEGVTQMLDPLVDVWYIAGLDVERGSDTEQMLERVVEAVDRSRVVAAPDPVRAWQLALAAANPDDRIVAFGSFHTVGDILAAREKTTQSGPA